MADAIYQTLSEFIKTPFGSYDNENYHRLNILYSKSKNAIKVENVLEYKDTFMIHVKIPSESKPGTFYDVVIQFIPTDESEKNSRTLDNYIIQFFSNSPSFIYRYAVLYKTMGFMIDAFQEKMDPKYADTLPTKTNANMKLTYDKSIFLACRYIQDYSNRYMSKPVLRAMPRVNFNQFVDSVVSFEGQKPKYSIYEIEASFNKELIEDIQKVGKHMSIGFKKPQTPHKTIEREGVGIVSKKKAITKIKAKTSTFGTSSFGGMKLTPIKKVKKTGTVHRKPKVRSTKKGQEK